MILVLSWWSEIWGNLSLPVSAPPQCPQVTRSRILTMASPSRVQDGANQEMLNRCENKYHHSSKNWTFPILMIVFLFARLGTAESSQRVISSSSHGKIKSSIHCKWSLAEAGAMWGVWGNSGRGLTHLVRPDKVTHVMQGAATGCRHWGRSDTESWEGSGLRLAVRDDGGEQSLVSCQCRPSETRNGEKNSDQSSPDISDDLFVSILDKREMNLDR